MPCKSKHDAGRPLNNADVDRNRCRERSESDDEASPAPIALRNKRDGREAESCVFEYLSDWCGQREHPRVRGPKKTHTDDGDQNRLGHVLSWSMGLFGSS